MIFLSFVRIGKQLRYVSSLEERSVRKIRASLCEFVRSDSSIEKCLASRREVLLRNVRSEISLREVLLRLDSLEVIR